MFVYQYSDQKALTAVDRNKTSKLKDFSVKSFVKK